MLFIGYYVQYGDCIKRSFAASAVNKMQYMITAFEKVYGKVNVFSCSGNLERNYKFFPSENRTNGNITIHYPLSWGGCSSFHDYSQRIWIPICLFFYLIFHTRKNEHVYVYHSVGYKNAILWAHALKKFKLILDVEEVYSDVQGVKNSIRRNEYKHFREADAFIFSTEMLNQKINNGKEYIVINGTYKVEEQITSKFSDGKIHIIYAGTFDPRKGGAAAAAAAAALPSNYVMHICGFGSQDDTEHLKKVIDETNDKSKCKIDFHGLLTGNDYLSLLQKCHIGLSTQNPNAAFNATSFPSKILSYLSNGLAVVSIRIPAIENSKVGRYLNYYSEQSPTEIAKAIMSVDVSKDYRSVIMRLSEEYENDLENLRKKLEVTNEI